MLAHKNIVRVIILNAFLQSGTLSVVISRTNTKVTAFDFAETYSNDTLLYGCVSQDQGTTKFANMIA